MESDDHLNEEISNNGDQEINESIQEIDDERRASEENQGSSIELDKIVVPGSNIIKDIDENEMNKYDDENESVNNVEILTRSSSSKISNNGNNNTTNENNENENKSVNENENNENDNENENEEMGGDIENESNSNNSYSVNDNERNSRESFDEEHSSRNSLSSNSRNNSNVSRRSSDESVLSSIDENKPSDDASTIFNYTSIYSNIIKNNKSLSEQNIIKLQEHIENKKKEKLNQSSNENEEKISDNDDNRINFTITTMTKDNFIDLLNSMTYDDIILMKDRFSEIGIYNQFNDILLDKQNSIIEKLIEHKQELQRKIMYQKEEINKLRNNVESYHEKMKFIRKKTLNDICNRCGISFDKEGNPHRVTVFGKPISKEEITEKTKIQSNLLEIGLESKKEFKTDEKEDPLEVMNEYFFTKNDRNPHIEDYNESYNRIKERQALIMLKSMTVNEKILLLNKQVRNAEITVRGCISALVEEQRKTAQMKAKYENALEIIRNLQSQQEKYMKDYKFSYYINGVVPIAENKELIDSITKEINNDPYAKLVNKSATMTPNYLNNSNPPLNKLKRSKSNTTTKLTETPNKVIPTIYVEEKTNSLNLELLEYKLENLKVINKLSLSDPPPPLTNNNYINYINNNKSKIQKGREELSIDRINNPSIDNPHDVSNNKDIKESKEDKEEVKKVKSSESIAVKETEENKNESSPENVAQESETPPQNEDNIESNNENNEISTNETNKEEDGNNNEEVNEVINENSENNENVENAENNGSNEGNESHENIENNDGSDESNEMNVANGSNATNETNETDKNESDKNNKNEGNNENSNKSSKISIREENKSKGSNEIIIDETFDPNQRISDKINYLNEILNIKDEKCSNNLKILSNSKYKKIDLKFSSDCENMFLPIHPSSLSGEKLQPRIITPKPPTKYKMTYDKSYRDSDKKISSFKVKLPSLSSYENNLKSKIIKNSKYKKNPYYQSKLVIDKF